MEMGNIPSEVALTVNRRIRKLTVQLMASKTTLIRVTNLTDRSLGTAQNLHRKPPALAAERKGRRGQNAPRGSAD